MFEINPVLFELSNGIRVVFSRQESFVSHLGVMIRAGSRFEKEDEEGLAHFVEHTIFKGTAKRKAFDIFSELDSVGGELNAYTNKEEMCLHASFRREHVEIASSLLGDLVQSPTFPLDELEREKGVVIDEINSYLDSPSERIFDEFESHLFKGHSLGYNILGTKETVSSFTQKMLQEYTGRLYTADRIVVSVVGDYELDDLRLMLEGDFGGIKKRSADTIIKAFDGPLATFNIREIRSNYQSHVLIGGMAPSYNQLDRRAMTLIINYLGGPALNSKLSLIIREKYGYAYNIEAGFTPYSDVGFWTIYAGTDNRYIDETLQLIKAELKEVATNGLAEKELAAAKEQLKGHIALSMDSNLELMFYLGKGILLHEKVDTIQEIYEQVDSITQKDVIDVANAVFRESEFSELVYEFA